MFSLSICLSVYLYKSSGRERQTPSPTDDVSVLSALGVAGGRAALFMRTDRAQA